uniref:Uncharacterized protein n=1 Tax=Romanomermis culicivorax TaxID=13658 RepID=A0A915K931_ROMCU
MDLSSTVMNEQEKTKESSTSKAQTGRPLSGIIRPGTNRGKPGTSMERTLRTARTASTSRPSTSMAGRFVRLGTASMAVNPGGPFVNLSRLNFEKYASQFYLAKPLFEYMFYCENDLRNLQVYVMYIRQCKVPNF